MKNKMVRFNFEKSFTDLVNFNIVQGETTEDVEMELFIAA
tara:strand:- start:295 stop:414 length:120 start_codon:yes stop_codon:yes gene_type:complete